MGIELSQIQDDMTDIKTEGQARRGVGFEVHLHCIINSNVSPVGSIVWGTYQFLLGNKHLKN